MRCGVTTPSGRRTHCTSTSRGLRSVLDPNRARGESSVIETVGTGYQLTVDLDRFDVARFERESDRGRALLGTDPAGAADALHSALSLWNGPAYDDFAYDDFVQAERTRLDEARLAAVEDRIEADLALGRSGELVSELESLRNEHPFRERLVGHHVLALYRSGRPADALRVIEKFRRRGREELGIEPTPALLRLEERVLLHDESIQPRGADVAAMPTLVEAANPYKGLRPFAPADTGTFFGRDALVAELLRAVGSGRNLVALVGASGSGKSSVVRAGLIPALAKGAIDDSDGWLVASMMPGAHPFAELEGALLKTVIDAPDSLDEQLRDGDDGLIRSALRLLPDEDARLLLVIDQFEELFSMVDDDAVRDRFLSNLVAAIDDPHDRITVLVTLRADFYAAPLQHPEFGARLGSGVVNVTQLTAEELEAAALMPAEQVGVAFEPALLGQLIADVGNQPGALPLFQYALTELFDRRDGDVLLTSTYRSMGGVDGALRRRADDLYDQLDAQQQEAARQLFLRLLTVTEHEQRSRRRVAAREVVSLDVDSVAMHDVIRLFGDHRLLSFDSDPLTGAPTVEVAHEALLTTWPALVEWIDEGRDDLRRHGSLAVALREWELADRNPDYLLTSARLAEYMSWSASTGMSLNVAEREFLEASSSRAVEEEAAADRRAQSETRARRRLWGAVGALTGALGVAAVVLVAVTSDDAGPSAASVDPAASVVSDDPAPSVVPGAPAVTVAPDDPPTVVVPVVPESSVMYFGNRLDEQWYDNVRSGLEKADRDLDMELVDVSWHVNPVAEFRELAASGPEFVVISEANTISFDPSVTSDFPDVQFGVVDGPVEGSNVTSGDFANEEGAFLAGVAAAMKTETGTVGFVGAQPDPETEAFRAGFEAGVHSIDEEITVLAIYVLQFADDINGSGRPDLGEARARALYRRDADVVFAVAGTSGLGVFTAAAAESDVLDRQLWAIGADNDQWFEVAADEQRHVLTSIIKRGDLASYRLVEHMLDGGPTGVAFRLGVGDDGFSYSQQGEGLTDEITSRIDQTIVDITEGRIDVPTVPTGDTLTLDLAGNDIDAPRGVDGFDLGVPIDPGTYDVGCARGAAHADDSTDVDGGGQHPRFDRVGPSGRTATGEPQRRVHAPSVSLRSCPAGSGRRRPGVVAPRRHRGLGGRVGRRHHHDRTGAHRDRRSRRVVLRGRSHRPRCLRAAVPMRRIHHQRVSRSELRQRLELRARTPSPRLVGRRRGSTAAGDLHTHAV